MKKKISKKEALKIIGGSLDKWGSFEKLPDLPKDPNNVVLTPIGKDGKEIEWYGRGWKGVIDYAAALGIDYTIVGSFLEKTFGNRTTFNQIMLAQAVHKSLAKVDYYRRPRIKIAPTGKESDMHYAIRMDQKKIFKLYEKCGGKAKNKFKAIEQMYRQTYKSRKEFVEAYLYENKLNSQQRKDLAERKQKAIDPTGIMKRVLSTK